MTGPEISGCFDQEDEGLCKIFDMDPGKPLSAAPDGTSDIFLKEGDHLTEGPSLFSQDDAKPGDHNPGPFSLAFKASRFPFDGKPG